jgi:hypothetical protein
MKALVFLGAGFVIALLGYIWLLPVPSDASRFDVVGDVSYLRVAVLFAAMLGGIFAKGGVAAIKDDQTIQFLVLFFQVVRSAGFVKSVLVSPLVFSIVYKAAGEQPDSILAVLLAFQNGFFWQAVLEPHKRQAQEQAHEQAHE